MLANLQLLLLVPLLFKRTLCHYEQNQPGGCKNMQDKSAHMQITNADLGRIQGIR